MFALMIFIILALIIVIFAVQNAAIVPVQFLFWATDLPLVLVIFCSVFAGALLMFCLALMRELKQKMNKRSKPDSKGKITLGKASENKAEKAAEAATESDPIDVSGFKKVTNENGTQEIMKD